MIVVLLALGAALGYGLSDFLGGIVGKRAPVWSVATAAAVGGGLLTTVAAMVQDIGADSASLAWGAVAGVGNGFGTAFLYRGLAGGRMGVVSPVSGVTAAVLPVVVGVLSGERPSALVWAGVAVALPAIWLVAREPTGVSPTASGLVDGILAGLGFGALFAALAQIPDAAGFWPLTVNQVVGVVVIALVGTFLGERWVPRSPTAWVGSVSGVLGGLASIGFLVATQHGLLTVSAVLSSLYPAATVLLAALVLKEPIHRPQIAGLGMCAVTVVCVAVG